MAMPIDSAKAEAIVTSLPCAISAANTAPMAMPSGMLCKVTASTIIVVLCRLQRCPSASSLPRCRCGMSQSNSNKNAMPPIKPQTAGRKESRPSAEDISMAGMSSDHTLAATITPEAKPSSAFCTRAFICRRITKTHAAPALVPINGRISPRNIFMFIHSSPHILSIVCLNMASCSFFSTISSFQPSRNADELQRLAYAN